MIFPYEISSGNIPEPVFKIHKTSPGWIFIDKPLENHGVLTAIEKI